MANIRILVCPGRFFCNWYKLCPELALRSQYINVIHHIFVVLQIPSTAVK
jgi:hypothetical protein